MGVIPDNEDVISWAKGLKPQDNEDDVISWAENLAKEKRPSLGVAKTEKGSWWTPERVNQAVNHLQQHAALSPVGAQGLVARWAGVEAKGGPNSVNPKSGAVGIGQWLGSRKAGVPSDFEGQLNHAVRELNGKESAAAKRLRTAQTPEDAAIGASMYERAEGYNPKTGADNFVTPTIQTMKGFGIPTTDVWNQIDQILPNDVVWNDVNKAIPEQKQFLSPADIQGGQPVTPTIPNQQVVQPPTAVSVPQVAEEPIDATKDLRTPIGQLVSPQTKKQLQKIQRKGRVDVTDTGPEIPIDTQGNPLAGSLEELAAKQNTSVPQGLPKQQVQASNADAAVADTIDIPANITDTDQADKYVETELARKYGVKPQQLERGQFLGGFTPGKPAVITYGDLKSLGVDTEPLIREKVAQERVTNPQPDLRGLPYDFAKQTAEDINTLAPKVTGVVGQNTDIGKAAGAVVGEGLFGTIGSLAGITGGIIDWANQYSPSVNAVKQILDTQVQNPKFDASKPESDSNPKWINKYGVQDATVRNLRDFYDNATQVAEQTGAFDAQGKPTLPTTMFRIVGATPKVAILSSFPGGMIGGFAIEGAAISRLKGGDKADMFKAASKGALQGALFTLLPKAVQKLIGIEGESAARTAVRSGIEITGIGGGSYAIGAAFGDPAEENLINSAAIALFHGYGVGKKLIGKVAHAVDAEGNQVYLKVEGDNKARTVEPQQADVEFVLPKVAEEMEGAVAAQNAQKKAPEATAETANKAPLPPKTAEPSPVEAPPAETPTAAKDAGTAGQSEPTFYHATSQESANLIKQEGFKAITGKRSEAAMIKNGGVFLYENDPEAAKEFTRNFPKGEGTIVATRVEGKIYDSNKENKYGWEEDKSIPEIANSPKIIQQLKDDGYVGITGLEVGYPTTYVFDATKVKPIEAPKAPEPQTVTHPNPEIDGKPVLATTAEGKSVVANEANKSGISVVQNRAESETQTPKAPISETQGKEAGKEPWQMTKAEFNKVRPAVEGYTYHGSPEGDITTIDPYYHTKNWREGIGFYSTDSRAKADEYARGRTAKGERLTNAQEKGRVSYVKSTARNILDMDAPANVALWKEAAQKLELPDPEGKTNREQYRDLLDTYAAEYQSADGQYALEDFLKDKGIDATQHIEGIKSGTPHKVTIHKGDIISENGQTRNTIAASVISPDVIHREVVEQALKENKPVPPEVLKDYPDLAEKYAPKANVKEAAKPLTQPEPSVKERGKSEQVASDLRAGDRVENKSLGLKGTVFEAKDGTLKVERAGGGKQQHPLTSDWAKTKAQIKIDQQNAKIEARKVKAAKTGKEVNPMPFGPGAANVGDVPIGSTIKQLTEAMADIPKSKGGVSFKDRLGVADKIAEGKGSVVRGILRMKAVASALTTRPEVTEYKKALGDFLYEKQKSDHETRMFVKTIEKKIPNTIKQEAITNWIQAGGDNEVLQKRADASKGKLRLGYEQAMKLTDEEKTVARNIEAYYESQLEQGRAAGIIEGAVENYVNQIVKRKSPFVNKLVADVQRGFLDTNFKFSRKRIYESMFEGEQNGLTYVKPVTQAVAHYNQSFNGSLYSRNFIRGLTAAKELDGRPTVAVSGMGVPVEQGETADAYLIKPHAKSTDVSDYRVIDHPALRKWKWLYTDENGKPALLQGDMLVHPDSYQHLKNVLSKSALQQFGPTRTILHIQGAIKQGMMSISAFHPVQIGTHAAGHRVNPLSAVKGFKLDFDDPTQKLLVQRGLQVAHYNAAQEFGEGLAGGSLMEKIPVLGKHILKPWQEWMFQDYIPRIKMMMAQDAFERNIKRYENRETVRFGKLANKLPVLGEKVFQPLQERFVTKLTRDQIAELTAQQSNAAFGELNYKYMGRNPTFQDALRVFLLAPDFLEARARFVGQAAKPFGREQLIALGLLAVTQYMTARMLNKVLDDDYHWKAEDAFKVHYKDKWYGLRTIPTDIMHLLTSPRSFAYYRMSPFLQAGVIGVTGRDERGDKLDFVEQMKHLAMQPIPITFKRAGDQKWWEPFVNSMGIQEGKVKTESDQIISDYYNEKYPGGFPKPDDPKKAELKKKVLTDLREGKDVKDEDLQNLVDQGSLTRKDLNDLGKKAKIPPIAVKVKGLPLDVAMKVYEAGTPQEQADLKPILLHKLISPSAKQKFSFAERSAMRKKLE